MRNLPDFVVIGRPKSGTTTLGAWLAAQPDIFFCRLDEPAFFDLDVNWARGLDWYERLFDGAASGQLKGEGSTGYTHPHRAAATAARMAGVVPDARLIYLLRHPIERIRSEFRHRRIMGDETRGLVASLEDPHWHYIRQSMYFHCLQPYIERFGRDRILVVRTEDLTPDGAAWPAVIAHLGLPARPAPGTVHNVSADRGLYNHRLISLRRNVELRRRLSWIPAPLKRLPNVLLRRRGGAFDAMLDDSRSTIPDALVQPVWDDVAKLEAWLGGSLWPRYAEPSAGSDVTVADDAP